MNKFLELPLIEPIYSAYHHHGPATAITVNNPSIRNFYLNEVMSLMCSRKFLNGFTTPEIDIPRSSWVDNPHLDKKWFSMQFSKGYINRVIQELLNNGYYVDFYNVDDYYIPGKSWYKERHHSHNGLICGYNQEDKTYCMYAYDSNWIYQKFWTTQKGFNAGRVSMLKKGIYGNICGIKPKLDKVEFSPEKVYKSLLSYLGSTIEKHPKDGEGDVYGIIVHEYIAEYVDKLFDGSIPYDRIDRRVFRIIWEHKKAMLERIEATEKALSWDNTFSEKYKPLVASADMMRMLYASHHMKRRDSVLPVIKKKLLDLMKAEREILTEFAEKIGDVFKE